MSTMNYRLFGVGGAGGKIANAVAQRTGGRLSAVAIDTDFRAIAELGSCQQLRIGEVVCRGNGSGGDAAAARMAAREALGETGRLLDDVSVAVVVAGLGGGTGGGALPVLLDAAAARDVPVVLFLVTPFAAEGVERARAAASALHALDGAGTVRVVLSNDDLAAGAPGATVEETFAAATDVLADGLCLLWRCSVLPGYLNLSPGELQQILRNGRGAADFGTGAGTGPNRLGDALEELWRKPGLGLASKASSAKAALVCVCGGRDLRLAEVGETMRSVAGAAPMDATTRLATVLDPAEEGRVRVSVVLFREWTDADAGGAEEEDAAESAGPVPPTATAGELSAEAPKRPAAPRSRSRKAVPGRFDGVEGTFHDGQDLDAPTYLRKHLHVDLSQS